MKVSLFLVATVALVGAASANCMRGIFSGTQGSRESALISAACSAGMRGDELRQFMAQCAHECAHFNTMEEYASGAAYEGRGDLGNTQPGDGKRYKGRGYIQLTGRANYRTFGRALGLDLEGNPTLALQPAVASKVALKYWKDRVRPRVSNFCNTRDATYYINGGSNGLSDRESYFRKYGGCGGTSSGGGSTSSGGGSSKCSGKCINVQEATCGSTPQTGRCPGAWNIQCCTSSVSSSCSVCVKNGGGKGCVNGACSSASYTCKLCLNNFGGRGCKNKCTPSFDEMDTDVWSVPELGKNGKYAKTKWEQDEMDVDDEDAEDEEEVVGNTNWMTGCDRKKCPCGCEPCQTGLCRCYSWCRDEMDDEEAGGLSIEAGYEKDGKYAKIKYEKDEIDPDEDVPVFDEDDEEAGGFSIEAGYEKDGKYAKIKYEKDD